MFFFNIFARQYIINSMSNNYKPYYNMNKNRSLLNYLSLFLLLGSCVFAGCDKTKDSTTQNPIIPTPTPHDTTKYSFVEQKRIIDSTGVALLNMFPKDNFSGLADFGKGVFDKYEKYNWDNVQRWAEDSYNACTTFLQKHVDIEKGELNYDYYYYHRTINIDSISDYKMLLALSNFTGRFVATDYGSWNYDSSDILQFEFKDDNGRNCILSLTTSSENVKLMLPSLIKERTNWNFFWDEDTLIHIVNHQEDINHLELDMPKEIHLALTRDGNSVVDLALKTDISSLTSDSYFDLSQSVIGFNIEVKLDNGYGLVADELLFQGNKSVAGSVKILKDNNSLLSAKMSAAVSGFPTLEFSDEGGEAFREYFSREFERDNSNLTHLNVNVDILGKVQVKGKIENVREFYDDIRMADEFSDNESKFKDYLNLANRQVNVGLFFNGNDVKQADVKFMPFSKTIYDGRGGYKEYWVFKPVIVMGDGSQTSSFEDYFDEKEFKKVIQSFEEFIDQFERML